MVEFPIVHLADSQAATGFAVDQPIVQDLRHEQRGVDRS